MKKGISEPDFPTYLPWAHLATIIRRPFLPFFLFCLAFLATPVLNAQEPAILERPSSETRASLLEHDRTTSTRRIIDLSGLWSVAVNGADVRKAKVPSSADAEGEIVYQRTFSLDAETLKNSKLHLVALGINNEAEIFINEMFVGKHAGGYAMLELEIPDDVLQVGPENVLKVVVSNRLNTNSTFPLRKQIWGWKNYGGILRDIYIRVSPRIWVAQVSSRPSFDGKTLRGRVDVTATVSTGAISLDQAPASGLRRPAQHQIQFELFDSSSTEPIAQSRPVALELRSDSDVPVSAQLEVRSVTAWSPEAPHRYRLKATVLVPLEGRAQVVDEVSTMIAFGQLAIDKSRMLWNGRTLVLKGVVWHEQREAQGASLTADQMEQDVKMIKSLGANAVRFAFHPPHPLMIELCDRYGLFALVEIPLWNTPSSVLASEAFIALAEASARAMVLRDRSRISVLAWGLGSQFDVSSPEAVSAVGRLSTLVKELDGRPVYVGSPAFADDSCGRFTDIAALTLGESSAARLDRSLSAWKQEHHDKPVILLSYGHPVEFANRSGYSDPFSEEAQARFFVQSAPVIRDAKLSGSFINSFADWEGDRPIMTLPHRNGRNHPLGLVTAMREPKLAYEYVRAIYAGQRTTALPIGSARSSFPVVHVVAGFLVIFLIAYFYNYNRRFQDCFKRALTRTYNFFSDLRDVRIVAPLHTLLVALSVSLTLGVLASSLLYHYRMDARLDYLLSMLLSDAMKVPVITLAWDPLAAILVMSALFFAILFVTAIALKVLSVPLRARVRSFHLFTIVAWGGIPLLFLSPIAMALFKVLATPAYVAPVSALLVLMLVWAALRILKGFSVVADVRPIRVYLITLTLVAGSATALAFYVESELSLVSYVRLFVSIVGGLG